MPHFDTKEFGDAAQFLRKTDLELMATHTVAFDGRPNKESGERRSLVGQIRFKECLFQRLIQFLDSSVCF